MEIQEIVIAKGVLGAMTDPTRAEVRLERTVETMDIPSYIVQINTDDNKAPMIGEFETLKEALQWIVDKVQMN